MQGQATKGPHEGKLFNLLARQLRRVAWRRVTRDALRHRHPRPAAATHPVCVPRLTKKKESRSEPGEGRPFRPSPSNTYILQVSVRVFCVTNGDVAAPSSQGSGGAITDRGHYSCDSAGTCLLGDPVTAPECRRERHTSFTSLRVSSRLHNSARSP